ncbi:MAG TPA: MFS transporter [Pseudonocardia sp.]
MPDYRPDPLRWKALWVTLTAGFMSLLDVSIVAVALPSIEHSLGASSAGVQWVVSGYTLTFGLALVPAGRLGDAWGRRRMFLIALAGFVLTSALCGAAPTLELLIVARLVQGFTAGMLAPQNSGLIQELFRGEERGRAFGLFGATVGLSTAVGPVVGGVILAVFGEPNGWRWIFYVNLPIGILALVLAVRLVPAVQPSAGGSVSRRLDLVGSLLLGGGVLALMFPLLDQERIARLWWLFPAAVVLLAGFARWESWLVRSGWREPLLNPRLLTNTPGYAFGAALGTTYFIGFSGIWIVLAMYFQSGLGYTPLQSGLAVTPFAVGSSASAVLGGRLTARFGRRLTVFGLCWVAVGLLGAAFVLGVYPGPSAGLWASVPMLVAGIGGGLVIPPNLTLTLSEVPVATAGAAGGALQTGQRVGAAVGTALLAGVYYTALSLTGQDAARSILAAMLCAVLFVLISLGIGLAELRRARVRGRNDD